MEVNLSEKMIFGASQVINKGKDIIVKRMTQELENFYSHSVDLLFRANCSSGIRIRFKSDTSMIKLKVKYGKRCREIFSIDLLVDGVQTITKGPESYQDSYTAVFNDLMKKEKLLELYLPHSCETKICSLEISDDASFSTVPYSGKRWLFLGDSLTQGMTTLNPSETWPALLAKKMDIDFLNLAVGNSEMEGKLGELVAKLEWDIVSVGFGTNDFYHNETLEKVAIETRLMIKNLLNNSKKIIFITPPQWIIDAPEPNQLKNKLQDYRNVITDIVTEYSNVKVIHGEKLVDYDERMYHEDHVHLSNAGMKQYAERLFLLCSEIV